MTSADHPLQAAGIEPPQSEHTPPSVPSGLFRRPPAGGLLRGPKPRNWPTRSRPNSGH